MAPSQSPLCFTRSCRAPLERSSLLGWPSVLPDYPGVVTDCRSLRRVWLSERFKSPARSVPQIPHSWADF
eukprot:3933995-Rhodomonas_salina.1